MAIVWHLLTGEYPPDCGGVGDYTASLADALSAAGDEVHVWARLRAPAEGGRSGAAGPGAPAEGGRSGAAGPGAPAEGGRFGAGGPGAPAESGRVGRVTVHALPDAFGRLSRAALERGFRDTPGVVLLQYVPTAMGWRGANLPFCAWFARTARVLPDARVMVHEPYFYFTWARPWARGNALALVQRLMTRVLVRGARRVYQSTETWKRFLPDADRLASLQTLPIPSNVPAIAATAAVAAFRARAGADGVPLAGHFGTYGAHVANELRAILPAIVARMPDVRIALVGEGGPAFLEELRRSLPDVARRIFAAGRLDPRCTAAALRACDVLLQPYPDGITTRRTSAMAGLANGVATVTSSGALTESVWRETGAVALAPAGDAAAFADAAVALLRDASTRDVLAQRGAAAYAERFSMANTIAILRGAPAS
jgi:Glycosyl transferases group 1